MYSIWEIIVVNILTKFRVDWKNLDGKFWRSKKKFEKFIKILFFKYENTSKEPVRAWGVYTLTQRHYVFPAAVLFDYLHNVKSERDQTDAAQGIGYAADVQETDHFVGRRK